MAPEPAISSLRAPLDPAGAERLSGWLRGYKTIPGVPDELFDRVCPGNGSQLQLPPDWAPRFGGEVLGAEC